MENLPDSDDLRRKALVPGEDRDHLFLSHPLVTDSLFLATPQVKAAHGVLSMCITLRDTGACFVGVPRAGKTYAISVLQKTIERSNSPLVILSINTKQHDKVTEKAFFGDILEDLDLKFEQKTTAPVRRNRFKQYIKTRCSIIESQTAILFIDEAQTWSEIELTFIRDVSNDLKKFDSINLIPVLFATPQILKTAENLKAADRIDLIARFLRNPIIIKGLTKQIDLEEVLKPIDDPILYAFPDYSGVALSEFFIPRAYANGWRLQKEAPNLWRALLEELNLPSGQEANIGMSWIISSVRYFLFEAAKSNIDDHFFGSDKMWREAVRSGRYSSLQSDF